LPKSSELLFDISSVVLQRANVVDIPVRSEPLMDNPKAFAEQVFEDALELPRAERAEFLVKACKDAPAVQQIVAALLEKNDRLSGFLSEPPYKKAGATAERLLAPGARLGRYTIVGQLGAGGMGIVYRARDEKLEREVAIKMVSKGVLASEEARRHFRREAWRWPS
jgi:hypothetical protein